LPLRDDGLIRHYLSGLRRVWAATLADRMGNHGLVGRHVGRHALSPAA
jgi:hypothetical protein